MRQTLLIAVLLLGVGCAKSNSEPSILPTVQGQGVEKVACYPMPGRHGPVKWLPVGQGNTCMIKCVCHYGC